jgi:isocitrate dehydrogenase
VGTKEFGAAVAARIGQRPEKLTPASYAAAPKQAAAPRESKRKTMKKETVGVDVFLDWQDGTPGDLADLVRKIKGGGLALEMIDSRGVKVWPDGFPETMLGDHWRCRFLPKEAGRAVSHAEIAGLLQRAADAGLDFIKTENLCTFDGEPGYSLAQGQ